MRIVRTLIEMLDYAAVDRRERADAPRFIGNVAIFGVGGVGSWAAIMLALTLPPRSTMVLVDCDTVEESNLGRMPLPPTSIGKPKAEAVADVVQMLRPTLRVVPISRCVESVDDAVSILSKYEVHAIIEATDSPRAQRIIEEAAARSGIDMVKAHYDGKCITVEWLPRGEAGSGDWEVSDAAGYTFGSLVEAASIAASLAVWLLNSEPGERLTFSWCLDKLSEEAR